jgi:hypothetical protein
MRTTKLAGLLACGALLGVSPASASYIYSVSDDAGSLSVTGTITTDKDNGVLDLADILSWSLTISGPAGPSFTLTPSNSVTPILTGQDLTASPTALNYDFSDSNVATAGKFVFQDNGSSAPAGGLIAWCGVGTGCDITFNVNLFYPNGNFTFDGVSPSGDPEIATIQSVSQTPLPAALPLFGAGLGLMGLFGRRSRRKNTAAIAA